MTIEVLTPEKYEELEEKYSLNNKATSEQVILLNDLWDSVGKRVCTTCGFRVPDPSITKCPRCTVLEEKENPTLSEMMDTIDSAEGYGNKPPEKVFDEPMVSRQEAEKRLLAFGTPRTEECGKFWNQYPRNPAVAEAIERHSLPGGVKHDQGKPRWSLLPFREVLEVVEVLTYGSTKYSDDNWKRVPNLKTRYVDAALRHFTAWINGERFDPETNKSHLAHAVCCLLFLMWNDKQEATKAKGE